MGARTAPLDKARAIYDWIVDNTFRRAETRGCGLGNIAFMLETGDLGGKCADINSLYVGLARAAGLPARDFFGIRVADSNVTKSLGKSGDITRAQHCRAEVYIDRKGWFPATRKLEEIDANQNSGEKSQRRQDEWSAEAATAVGGAGRGGRLGPAAPGAGGRPDGMKLLNWFHMPNVRNWCSAWSRWYRLCQASDSEVRPGFHYLLPRVSRIS